MFTTCKLQSFTLRCCLPLVEYSECRVANLKYISPYGWTLIRTNELGLPPAFKLILYPCVFFSSTRNFKSLLHPTLYQHPVKSGNLTHWCWTHFCLPSHTLSLTHAMRFSGPARISLHFPDGNGRRVESIWKICTNYPEFMITLSWHHEGSSLSLSCPATYPPLCPS